MHNRARLVVASFLTKDLGIDWRWGERWFMRLLVDGDESQQQRQLAVDRLGGNRPGARLSPHPEPRPPARAPRTSDGAYVRRYVPELTAVPDSYLAEPWRMPEGVQREVVAAGSASTIRDRSSITRWRAGRRLSAIALVTEAAAGKPYSQRETIASAEANLIHSLSQRAEAMVVEVQMSWMGESVGGTTFECASPRVRRWPRATRWSRCRPTRSMPRCPQFPPAASSRRSWLSPTTRSRSDMLAQIDPNGARSDNGASADPAPLKESEGLVMGGGEGDEDLGDEAAGADSLQPGVTETPTPDDEHPRPTRPPRDADA